MVQRNTNTQSKNVGCVHTCIGVYACVNVVKQSNEQENKF